MKKFLSAILCKKLYLLKNRLQNIFLTSLKKMTGYHIAFQLRGQKKILKFNLNKEDCSYQIFKEVFIYKEYTPKLSKNFKFSLNDNDVVIDIGANMGLFSVFSANIAKKGKVYSIEPMDNNFKKMLFHKKINKLKNIYPINVGISDKEKEAKLYLSKSNCGAHSINSKESQNFQVIKCISLKDLFDKYDISKCDYLKIDCEGEEYNILYSLPDKYFLRIKKIGMETHPVGNADKLVSYLETKGFETYLFDRPNKRGMIYALKVD